MVRPTFAGFSIATSGLFMAQRAIDVTGHNISNVDTLGYSRQRLITTAVEPKYGTAKLAMVGKGNVGRGVTVMSLEQVRDKFLDKQYRAANSTTNYWQMKSEGLYYVEDIFNNIGENSLNDILKKFFSGWSELSEHPSDAEYRTTLREQATALTTTVNDYYNRLVTLQNQKNDEIEATVTDINRIALNIASLNEAIYKYEQSGDMANDLRDKRNLLLDELSGLANISYSEDVYGRMTVTMGDGNGTDNVLVSHKNAYELEVVADVPNAIDPALPDMYSIEWKTGPNAGQKLDISNGAIKAYTDMRDGDGVGDNPKGIPYYVNELNKLVEAIVTTVNGIHETGWSMPYTDNSPGSPYASRDGIYFFDPANLTAGNMSLSADVLDSVYNICASDTEILAGGNAEDTDYQTGNNKIALAIMELNNATGLTGVDSFEGFIKSFLVTLATEADYANNMTDTQYVVLANIENNRMSISGVSIDEEASNLIKFQHAYNAAARCMTTMDEMLDKLINGTGRVGL